jgi:hypothetical protein
LSLSREQTNIGSLQRENYRRAFDGFDPALIAHYDGTKVAAAIHNVKAFLALTADGQTLAIPSGASSMTSRSRTAGLR